MCHSLCRRAGADVPRKERLGSPCANRDSLFLGYLVCRPRRRGARPRCQGPTSVPYPNIQRRFTHFVQVLISWAGCSVLDRESLPLTSTPRALLSPSHTPFTGWSVLLASCVRCSWSRGADVLTASVWSIQHRRGAAEITGGKRKRRLLGSSKRLNANAASWRRQTSPKDPTCAENDCLR